MCGSLTFPNLTYDMHIMQLSLAGHLVGFISIAKRYFETTLYLDTITKRHYSSTKCGREIRVQLMPFVSEFFVDINQKLLFGHWLSVLDLNLI